MACDITTRSEHVLAINTSVRKRKEEATVPSMPARAQLRLGATTKLSPPDCLDLVRDAIDSATPGANYAGQGLFLSVTESDRSTMSVAMGDGRSRQLCNFTAEVRVGNGMTTLRVGGLDDCMVLRHTVMFVPVGKEINGFGYYKRLLTTIETRLRAADSDATITVGIP